MLLVLAIILGLVWLGGFAVFGAGAIGIHVLGSLGLACLLAHRLRPDPRSSRDV